MSEFEGELLSCVDCGRDFVWSAAERDSSRQKGDAAPELCRECRQNRQGRRVDTKEKGERL